MLIGGTRDGRLLARQIEEQFVDWPSMYAVLADYEPRAGLSAYLKISDLPGYLASYVTTAVLAAALVPFLTISSASATYLTQADAASTYAMQASLSGYVTTETLASYLTTSQTAAAIANAISASDWSGSGTTNASGMATIATPAGRFGETAPKFVAMAQLTAGNAGIYNVQQDGPVVQSGSLGSRVYTATFRVNANQATVVALLGLTILSVQAPQAGVVVNAVARV